MKDMVRLLLASALTGPCLMADTVAPQPLETVLVQFSNIQWIGSGIGGMQGELLNLSFLLEETLTPFAGGDYGLIPQIVPGSVNVNGSGFLGSIDGNCSNCNHGVNWSVDYMALLTATGDEIDVRGNGPNLGSHNIQNFYLYPGDYAGPELNNLIYFWSCKSFDCYTGFGSDRPFYQPAVITPKSGTLTVTRVPEYGDTLTYLAFNLAGLVAAGWFLRRRLAS